MILLPEHSATATLPATADGRLFPLPKIWNKFPEREEASLELLFLASHWRSKDFRFCAKLSQRSRTSRRQSNKENVQNQTNKLVSFLNKLILNQSDSTEKAKQKRSKITILFITYTSEFISNIIRVGRGWAIVFIKRIIKLTILAFLNPNLISNLPIVRSL